MSFAQIHASAVEGHTTDAEAPLQMPNGEGVSRGRVKFGIVGSVILVCVALIFVVAPTSVPVSKSSDLPQSVISLGAFTSPYYEQSPDKYCPEGEMITDKEVCRKAGAALGYGKSFAEKSSNFILKGCSADFGGKTRFNTKFDSAEKRGDAFCQRKPEDMPDFAALKADLTTLTFHCLGKVDSFQDYRNCLTQIHAWSESDDEVEPAPAPDCWKKNADMYSGGYAGGVSSKFDLDSALAKCRELGSSCAAVTCKADDSSCTVRSSTTLKPSSNSEVSYTYTC